jgi:outer membrane protein assembly factor BamB
LLLNASGTTLQSWNLPNEVYCVARDSAHHAAYAGMHDQGIRALDTTSGAVLWNRSDVGSCLYLGIDGSGNVYAGVTSFPSSAPKPTLLKLSRTDGTTLWSYQIGDDWPAEPRSLLVETGGICYVGTRNHELHKVDASGTRAWKMNSGTGPSEISTAVHSLIKSGTRLFAGLGDGNVLAVEADGTVSWRHDIGDRTDCMALGSGEIFLGSWHGISALDTSGNPLWFREVTGGVISMLHKGNRLYGASRDGWVYEVDVPSSLISYGSLVTVGDILRLNGVVLSAGGTRKIPYADLDKILRVRPL